MHTIATAGHVDHGKSTLVSALTGINPDRLKEEKSRQMTIDLGFAWMNAEDGEPIGIIDVPGHRDFIENMLAGVGGIDAALFVIAADEGVMPQTREHLAILDLLAIKTGIIVLTKIDLVESGDWLDMVEEDVRKEVAGTFLEKAKILRVSAKNTDGIKELRNEILLLLENSPERIDRGKPRLSLDRVFSMTGFGTIVTGTLNDGTLHTGDEVRLLPSGLTARIRGMQTHNKQTPTGMPGSRVAINISGVEVGELKRGDFLTTSNDFNPSFRFDAFLNVLPVSTAVLKHNQEVKIFHFAAERIGRLRLLGKNEIRPGETGFVQIELTEPLIASNNDRFVIRIPSPGETVGGGLVLQTNVSKRYKRFSEEVINHLSSRLNGSLTDRILVIAEGDLVFSINKLLVEFTEPNHEVRKGIDELISRGDLIDLSTLGDNKSSQMVISKNNWQIIKQNAIKFLTDYHKKNPLKQGMPREELLFKLRIDPKLISSLSNLLIGQKIIFEENGLVRLPEFSMRFSVEQENKIKQLLGLIKESPYSPPAFSFMTEILGGDLLNAAIQKNIFVRVSKEVAFREKEYNVMKEFVKSKISMGDGISVVEFRDNFQTSRKYSLAFLEHLDSIGFTKREGDYRIIGDLSK